MNRNSMIQRLAPLLAFAALAAGCVGSAETATGGASTTATSSTTASARDLTVPVGALVQVEFRNPLSSASARVGDRFSVDVVDPVLVDGEVAIDSGSTITGKVVEAIPAKKIGGQARLTVEFTSLELASGKQLPIRAAFHSEAKSQTKKDAVTIGGATAGGAILGRIIGHNRGDHDADGTSVGAVVGAAIGTAIAASNRGEEVLVPAGATVTLQLESPVQVPV